MAWNNLLNGDQSEFIGYELLESKSRVMKYAEIDGSYLIVLDKTPFYAEAGGQVADKGTIKSENLDLKVVDVQKENDLIIHFCEGKVSSWDSEDIVECKADGSYRAPIRRNHTATHLLHAALKVVLGDQVQQAGSLVHPDYLRFDFTYFEKISKIRFVILKIL